MKVTRKDDDFWNCKVGALTTGCHFSVKEYPDRIFMVPYSCIHTGNCLFTSCSSNDEMEDLSAILSNPTILFAVDIISGEYIFWDRMKCSLVPVHIYTDEELQLIINTSKRGE